MCGIAGLVLKKNDYNHMDLIKSMCDVIVHRGPDDYGYFNSGKLTLGHRRLSIIDLTDAGHQPMEAYNLVISYNGEIYNYLELKEELSSKGYNFKTNTDTEVILASYDYWGEDCLHKFNGMWAFALFDKQRNLLFCSRDRFGIKPFNYTINKEYFAFGSEVKQLLQLPNINKELDYNSVYNFLVENKLNINENTLFADIKELRGGFKLFYNLDSHHIDISKWYEIQPSSHTSFETATKEFEKLFNDSVNIRMRSDVNIGSCLSGGLDSSSIVCSIAYNSKIKKKLKTISSCYENKKYDEQEYIDIVTENTGFESVKIFPELNELFKNNIWDKMIYYQDQPIKGFSQFSEFKVFEKAAEENLTVMLDGQGSDEYLAGYPEFYSLKLNILLKKYKYFKYISELKKYSKTRNINFYRLLIRRAKNNLSRFLKRKENKNLGFTDEFYALSTKSLKHNYKDLSELSYDEVFRISIPFQLHSEDRNSMLNSIESRLPFLDYRLVEYTLNLPDDYKIRNGVTKYILRESLKNILPIKIKDRHDKKGFPAPDEVWIKNNPTEVIKELKNAIDNNPTIFDNRLILTYQEYLQNSIPYSNIWVKAISFQKWKTIFNL